MKKTFSILIFLFLYTHAPGVSAFAAEKFWIYPLPSILLSEKAEENKLFLNSLSRDGSGDDKEFAKKLFLDTFNRIFSDSVTNDMENKDRFNTFIAFLNIARASQYEINKTENIVDLYLPITMSINFVNVVTGELIYSYAYTYYSNYNTTIKSLSNVKIIELYRESYKSLLEKILEKAKTDFHPLTINANVKKKWKDYYILDKGKDGGIDKGDTLTDRYGNQLKVEYAGLKYSVSTEIMGNPKSDSVFSKMSNESIDEIKKPKIMPLSVEWSGIKSIQDEVVLQLFSEALGKKADFSMTSKEKSFNKVRNKVPTLTKLSQKHLEERKLPDYFLRLFFYGPFYVSIPTNKKYACLDNYEILACVDILDNNGRFLYTKCVEEKISDEVISNIRFANEAREEVIVKNSLISLANELIKNIKFKDLELPIIKSERNQLVIEDKYNVLNTGANLTTFVTLGKIGGIEGIVYVPTWEIDIVSRDNKGALANKNLALSPNVPEPSTGDMVFINNMQMDNVDNTRVLKMCKSSEKLGGDLDLDGFKLLSLCAISGGIKYPLFASEEFKKDVEMFNKAGYGFKGIMIKEPNTEYCIEPVYKITQKEKVTNNQFDSYKLTILTGLKIYDGSKLIWKKGLEQDLTINAPRGYEKPMLDIELSKRTFKLLNDIAKKIDFKNN